MIAITVSISHALAAGYAWFWSNLGPIAQFCYGLGIVLAFANHRVKKYAEAHPDSKSAKYLDEAFGTDPENRLGKVISVLDRLAANRRH